MKLFAVRTIEEHEPVGFFWVRGLADLCFRVEDVCDPGQCEYKPITEPGGLVWPDECAWQMGVETGASDPPSEEAHFQLVKAGLDFYGALEDFTVGVDVEGWTKCFRGVDFPSLPEGKAWPYPLGRAENRSSVSSETDAPSGTQHDTGHGASLPASGHSPGGEEGPASRPGSRRRRAKQRRNPSRRRRPK